jgi:hypothetical protein
MTASVAQPVQPPKVYRLRALTGRIGQIILEVTAMRFWVRAHPIFNKGEAQAGHFYRELVDLDDAGRQVARKLKEAGMGDALACVRDQSCESIANEDIEPLYAEHLRRSPARAGPTAAIDS